MTNTIAQLEGRVSALETRVNDVVRVGKIAAVQQRPYRAQVDVGVAGYPVTTGWLPVLLPRAGETLAFPPTGINVVDIDPRDRNRPEQLTRSGQSS